MTRLTLALLALPAATFLTGCTLEGAGARMDQPGTCFLYVEQDGPSTFTVIEGVGDGTKTPLAMRKSGLDAAQADALWAKERKIMDINPECLHILAHDRSQARPAQ